MEIKTEIAKRLIRLRGDKTLAEFCETVPGLAVSTYHAYELCKSYLPTDKAIRIAEVYDVSPAYLLGVVSEEEGNLLLK